MRNRTKGLLEMGNLGNILIKICGELPLSAILRKFLQINIWASASGSHFAPGPMTAPHIRSILQRALLQVICVYVKDNPDGLSPCQVQPLCAAVPRMMPAGEVFHTIFFLGSLKITSS